MQIKCIICGKKLKQIIKGKPEQAAYLNGGVHTFIPGYGSNYDMCKFILGICDDCISEKVSTGVLIVE
jgi:ribosomal protein L34E